MPRPLPIPAFSAAIPAADPSAANTGATVASGKVKVPAPQKRSAIFFAPCTASIARATMAASASGTACRKPPAGRGTIAGPNATVGWRSIISVSPARLSLASPAVAAASMARI